jgi:hypothetical protein
MIGDRPIGVSNIDVSANPSTPSGERAITELDVLNAESLALVSLQPLPGLIGQRNGVVDSPPSSMLHPVWLKVRASKIRMRFSMNPPWTVLRQPYPDIAGWSRNVEEYTG